jgi:hypothetical protein
MKNILTVFCFIFSFGFAQAQEVSEDTLQTARNSLFVELGGNGGTFSLNYDRLLHRGGWFHTSARAGIAGYWWNGGGIGIPLELNALIGKHKHFFEVGTGLMPSYGYEKTIHNRDPSNPVFQYGFDPYFGLNLSGRLGYRFQKSEGGFMFRASYTPFTTILSAIPWAKRNLFSGWHWFGVSVGRSF